MQPPPTLDTMPSDTLATVCQFLWSMDHGRLSGVSTRVHAMANLPDAWTMVFIGRPMKGFLALLDLLCRLRPIPKRIHTLAEAHAAALMDSLPTESLESVKCLLGASKYECLVVPKLPNATSLRSVHLAWSAYGDVSPNLQFPSSLRELRLEYVKDFRLKWLETCPYLEELFMKDVDILADVSGDRKIPSVVCNSLKKLTLAGVYMEFIDWTNFVCPKLECLCIDVAPAWFLTHFQNCTALRELRYTNSFPISNHALAKLTKLEVLTIFNTRVFYPDGISKLPNLSTINFRCAVLSYMLPLSCTDTLLDVDISYTQVDRLDALMRCAGIRRLRARKCAISYIPRLACLGTLTELDMGETKISSIEVLAGAVALERLLIDKTYVTAIESLSYHPRLWDLELTGCAIYSYLPVLTLPRINPVVIKYLLEEKKLHTEL